MSIKDNTINVFSSYTELQHACAKRNSTSTHSIEQSHYRRFTQTRKGNFHTSCGHNYREVAEDGYNDACEAVRENRARYIRLYNERYKRPSEDELKHTSLWLDYNHSGLNSYHGVDAGTKFCTLHLPNEKPYYYQGIELEVTWDDETLDGYSGDRYDEYGDLDECGDYDDEGNYIPDTYDFDLDEIVSKALQIGKGLFTAERDGSLYAGYSAEFVSRPLSTNAWRSQKVQAILKEFTDYLKESGALVNQPEGNGFHIHVSKKFFEANPSYNRTQREVARDMNWIFQKYQEEIELIGGREYNGWCASVKMNIKSDIAREYGLVIDKAHISKDAVELPYGDHRKAFIDSNSGNTYEARVFHSTLDPQRIMACLEFMRNISHGARENALTGLTFGQITRFKDSPNLQAVIKQIKANKQKLCLGKKNTNRLAVSLVN